MALSLLSVFLICAFTTTTASQFHFTQSSYNVSIPEHSAKETLATTDQMVGIFVSDPGSNVSYHVVSGDPAKLFKIEERLVGDFWFLSVRTRSDSLNLNRERKDKYVLTVTATATSGLEATTIVTVNIVDTNDLSPLFYYPEYSTTVPEDLAVHSSVIKVFAEDADLGRNGEVYYSFLEISEQFAIHPVTGLITLTRPLRYSERSVYDLQVLARDRGIDIRGVKKPFSKTKVQVLVAQVNQHGPEIYVYHLPEISEYSHADVYAIVRVIDRDDGVNGEVHSLTIVDGDNDGHFRITPLGKQTAGVKGEEFNIEILKLAHNTSVSNRYNLTLRAIDKGRPARTTYISVLIKIKEYTFNKPVFDREIYEIDVSENTPINSSIIRLKIDDRDSSDIGQILLEIVGGNEAGEFYINPRTGVLYTAVQLDAEMKTFYTLTVSAIDHGTGWTMKQSSAKVKVQVVDTNDNDPQFDSSDLELWVSENEPAGTSTAKVTAKDRDSGENAYISYSIANLNHVPFEIDHFTGTIRTTKVLDYESMRREYNLYIRASDWGTPFRRQSEMRLKIRLKDVNDNKPLFEKTDCVGYLPRQVPIDTEVITLSAIDLDAGNIISYRIASGNEDGCFSLDVTSGMLSVACDLSDVGNSDRHINVTAYDGTHFADFARVHIKLINSDRPRDFLVNGESASFDCKDLGVAKRLTEVLALAEKNNGPKSREEDEVTLPNRYGTNSHAPQLISMPNEIQINESVPLGFTVMKVKAVDRDLGYNGKLIFGITAGDVDSTFSINQDTGDIRVTGYLDRERRERYYLNITVFDLGRPQLSSSRMLSIYVLDVNDNAPVFDKAVVSFKVKEDTLSGTEIFCFKATDNDLGENSHVWYQIVTDTKDFQIDSRSGMLTVGGPLDRESKSLYELKIKASDRASDPNDPDALHSYALARIVVEDVNDEAPVFPSQTYLVKAREDVPVGTVVVTVDAWDPDLDEGGMVRYSLSQPVGDLPFSVDSETGTLRTKAPLNYEERQMYSIILRGEDQGVPSLWAEVNLTIEITDVNENVHPPRFEDFAFSVRVRENQPVETLVTTLRATDADPPGEDSRVSYRIVSGSGLGFFNIDSQGNIRTEAVLDRETTPHYWLTVYAYDHGVAPLRSRAEVFVLVEDENDNVPMADRPAYSGHVLENCPPHTSVLRVSASDADQSPGEKISFNITAGNMAGHFTIDDTGVILTTTDQIDREEQEEYVLEVTLTDNGTPPLSSTVQVVVLVKDENDNSPQFDQTFYHIMIPEVQNKESTFIIQNEVDASESDLEFEALFVGEAWHSLDSDNLTGYPVFRLLAVDSDCDNNGKVQYQVKSSHDRFSIHQHSGVVFAQRPVLANHDFDLLVRASDLGSPQRRSTVRVSVHVVGPGGDGRPSTLSAPNPHFTRVTELDPEGYLVAVVQPPVVDGTIVWFSIVAGDPREEFIIGVDSGSVQLARQLDCETQNLYNLTISLSDSHRTVYTYLLVEVVDSNEFRPEFSQAEYSVTVEESARPGTSLVHLTAIDSDVTSLLIYSVHNSRSVTSLELFDLDHMTGQLIVAQPLDRESISEHILTVVVSDSSSPVKRNFARVIVHVTDSNDHAPQWSGGVIQAVVLENAFVGSRVVTVVATDRDHGANAAVTYAIVSGNVGNYFSINPVMGDISVARDLDCEEAAEFNLIVRAVDQGSTPLASTLPVFITVRQSDHAPPRFEEIRAVAEVEESAPVGWIVWQARARSALSLTYDIEDGNSGSHFTINPTTGVVSTQHPLDYETRPSYNLTVSATNMAGVRAEIGLVVDVVDCNDNSPRFLETEYRGRISEDATPGSLVLTDSRSPLVVKAEDADSAILQYDIVESVPRRIFYIDPSTGAIRTQGQLDYEETESVTFHVQVRDTGSPQLSGRDLAKVWVQVTDVNDCPPHFSQTEYNTTVLLPTFNNVSIVQVQASDCDSPNITKLEYSIVTGNYENVYAMSGDSGVISLKNKSRGIHKSPHRLKVAVSDGPHTAFAFVNIKWEWSSESTLKFQQDVYEAAIVENSTKTVTVAVVSVVGAELNELVVFSLLNPSPLFHVGPTSGAIQTTGMRFDREHQDHFQLIVQGRSETTGAEVRVAQTLVNISVLDINDNCPVFVGLPYYGTVPVDSAKGDVITKVHAIDLDSGENGEVRYELMRGHGELFRVHRKTGEVILKQPLESQVREYQLSIAAYDGGMTPCSTEVWVHLTVVDRTLPLFDKQFYTAVVAEDVAAHTVVPVTLDTHVPHGMKLYYSIVAGNEYEIFTIDFGSGVLRVADELDFEDAQEHSLTVKATDLHSGVSAETLVKVKITDINDCHPEFPVNMYHTTVSEAAAPGSFVIKVSASDKDTGPGGVIRYSLKTLEGMTSDHFTIEPEDGSVYLKKGLDRENLSAHKLVVVATDTGIPNLATSVHLWIKVLDTNDNPPHFARSVFVSQLSSEAVRGQFVCRVQARDPDLDRLQYNIVSRGLHHMFSIEPDTGVLQLMKLPKSLPVSPLELNVSVSDGVHMSFCTVAVDLQHADHGAPVFLADHYEITLPENMAEPSFLVLVAAEDTDSEGAIEGEVTYSLPSDKHRSMVSIDPLTGLLRSRKPLDRERRALYDILVMASDTSGHVGFTTVRLTITDVNDNVPKFMLPEFLACVPSNLTVNSAFLKVRATDADKGPAAQVMYTLHSPPDSEILQLFGVHPISGTLYLQQPVLSLEGQVYQFFVRATDRGSPSLHSDVPVGVYIMDFNDELPAFQRTDETFFIPEDAPLGYNITQLVLSTSLQVDYRLLATGSQFSVSPDGWLYLSAALDREAVALHTLGAVAQSRAAPRLATLDAITVVVLDSNDNRPVFHSALYRTAVAENIAVGTSIMQVEAEDADEGRNGEVYYLLEGEGVFTIDTYTGWVVTAGTLDRELKTSYNLTVVAVDNGSPALSSSTSLLVDLIDYNDNPPVFSQDVYSVSVKEDLQEGSEVLQLEASDLDSESELKFYISGGDPDLQFAMDEAVPGVMYLRRGLDRELRDSYRLTVVVSDSKFIATAQVALHVLDVNDERPYCVQSRYYATLAENVAPGTFVLTVAVEDPDLQPTVTFHLAGDGADHFYLHKDKGELKTSKLLDRETMPRYSLKAYAYDDSYPEWECVSYIELTMTDVNDNAPEFHLTSNKVSLSEDSAVGAFITKLTAVDVDRGVNRKIRYYLVNSGENHFEVDKDSAIVRLAKTLDREAQSMFTLILKAVDSGMPQLWTLTTLHVTVLDVNDNPPEFLSRSYAITVPENISVSSEIVKVDAISKDTGVNAQIIYTIVEGNEQGKFDLHPITGVISVVQQIDYEQTKWYLLTVLATDQGLPPLSSQTTVNITVLDSNDNAPVFSQTAFSAQVPEDVQVGEIILKLEAADRDSGANARVGYSLESGDSLHQFSLDLNTGELSVAKTLDRESIAEYSLTIQASDFGSPQLSSSVFISVSVLDVNDNPPTLTQDNYTFFVQEDKMPGWAVGQMIVSDVDTFPNGAPFSFSILSGNADLAFRVVSDGTLYTAARLSTRVRSVYYLQVRVGDSGFPPLHTDSWITVKVIEESQFAPTVLPLEVFIIAYQERWPGGEIGHLIASDQDPYDTLVFALEASPAGQGQFSVEPRRGVLTAGPMVDAGRYRLNISVSDGKFTTHTTVTVHVLPLWEDMLQHSVSIRLRSMTAHHFVLRQWKSLVQLLESALLRQVSLTSLQAVPHGDLDILLTITGGVELAVLSEALQSAGLSGANWSCDCHNGALCRQKVQIQRDLVFTVATDHVSFVCPGHSHQLYCACNLGYGGEYCEEILPGGECGCPPPQGCVPQAGAPGGYICVPPSCPPSHSCPPATTASIHWEEIVAVIVAFLIVSCLVAVFILYRRCHRISPGNRVDKSELNHVIKRTSKLSNLQVTQPSRPTSYTCSSNNEVFSAVALNNAERGTAEADNVPPDYRRNLMSPHHKINNDLKQTADIPLHQVIPAEDDTRTIGGFHWDCTEWLQNGDVHTTILGDSSSYHSNDSCLTGNIRTEAVLDRETTPHYWLTVYAYDHGVAPLRSRAEVFVLVEDENDNVPIADRPAYSGHVLENCPPHTSVLRVSASDADQSPGEKISFNITAGNMAGHFTIDDTGFILTTTDQIDREEQEEYVLEVTLTDNGTPPLSSTVQVVVLVKDENDNSPQFDQTFYHIMIPEVQNKESTFIIQNEVDASESDLEFEALFVGEAWHSLDSDNLTGYPVFRLLAVDSDCDNNGKVQYQVKSSHDRFSIHQHSGVVFAQRPVLANHDFDLLVRASDLGSPQRRSTVRVSVHVVGPGGDGRPSTLSAPNPHFTRVTELDPEGYLVAVVQPPVVDGTIVWFSIVAGDPREEFIIGVDSGSVQLARQLDCETQNLYNLTISLSDSHRTVYTYLLVEVVDSNEFRPEFSQAEYSVTVEESARPGTSLVHLTAIDSDVTSLLIYSVHNSRSVTSLELFDLDHMTGQLIVAQPLDRESISEHILTVVVSDSSSPVKRNFARVIVHVTDSNDHAPQWSGGVIQAVVLENAFVGSRVVTVVATDRDHGANAAVTYAIVSGNVGNYFSINPVMGDISVARDLDCEEAAEFNLIVRAVDQGSTPLASTLPVFITVRQSDHAPPRFEEIRAVAEVEESAPVGWIVWQARARSALSLTYDIEDGNSDSHFTINPTTGVVSTQHPLDYETRPSYNLTVSATNMAGVRAEIGLVVDVVDCNDNSPRFLETEYRGRISEDATPGSLVLTDSRSPLVVKAEDADSAILQYDIVESVPRRIFYIDPSTGAIRTQGQLDYEETESVTFHVQVRDTGSPQLSGRDLAKVWVQVTDVNDCPPHFSQTEYNTTVLLPTFNNVSIVQVQASDCDSPNITKLEYSIVTGNYENVYAMSGDSGVISLKNKSRGIHKSPHRLKVAVSDGPHTAFSFVNIKWEWSSESTLKFQQDVYEAAIVENSTKTVTVAVVSVVGAELNELVVFSLLNPSPLFHVGPTSGAIQTTGMRFDREHQDHFQLIVQGRSETTGAEVRVAQTLVNISVLDINDNCPVFVGLPYYGTVPVDSAKGDVITKVHAIDLDSGENGEVRYELMRGHGELFRVHRKTGEVILKQPLESQVREYQLSIAAYDGGMTPCSTEVWVHLTVVDRTLPLFDKQFYTAVVAEDVAAHTVVPVTLDTHVPHGMKLYYSIVAGNEYEIFTIDFGSGVLRVADELDFEDAQEHSLTVKATDLHSGVSAETLVKVKITDINDCHPEFPVNMYHTTVSEAAAPGSFVIKVSASDKDTGPGGVIRYSLKTLEGMTSDHFTIEPEDGSVYLKKGLDRENLSAHKLVVVATDTGIPNLATSVHLWIKVLDTNDNPPHFARSVFVSQLSSEAVRSQFVCRVQARDPDLDRLQYNIVSRGLHHMFSIEPDTGVLQLMKLPKSLPVSPLELNVSVSDGVHMSFCTVAVDLQHADHGAPVFLADHYEITLPENMAEPSFLVLVAAEDTDSEGAIEGEVTYSLPSDKHRTMVSIDPLTGLLRSRKPLDRERRALYDILVMASDTSGHVGFTTVRLTITDVNDNVPKFMLPEYLTCVPSNLTVNSAFLKVRATDADKGPAAQVMYTLHSPPDSEILQLFGVHPISGTLYLQQPVLSLEGQVYQFFVRATDRGSPSLHSDVPVRVYIMDFNDELPAFQRTDETFFIPEDAPLGYNITQLVLSTSLQVDYRLLATGSQFSVSPDGWLYLSAALDREAVALHTLGAVAQSRAAPRLATLDAITVVVLDSNDNRPVFHSALYRTAVAENIAVGTSIMQVEAEDADEGRNGEVYYLLEGEGVFTIDTYTGWVVTAGTLDRELKTSYNLTVVAVDNGSPALRSSTSLLVDLIDYNDNPPVFSQDVYTVSVKEDLQEGSEVLQLEASDLDSESELKFYISGGDPDLQFAMDEGVPGVMYLRRGLDRELRDSYRLTVVVSDSKFIATAQVALHVLDVNDERPYCVQSRYYATLAENVAPGTFVLTVAVEDPDLQPTVTFHLAGDGADHFYLHKDKGELKTSKLLDRETMPRYSLKAYAYDDSYPEWECVSYIELTMTDVNDNAPEFHLTSNKVSLSEDSAVGAFITKLTAVDVDRGVNRKIRYYLVNSGENHFEVDKDSAIVRLAKTLDREAQSMFTLILKAVDSGMPQLWTLTTLHVTVLDVNDNPPEFLSRSYAITVPENISVSSEIVKVDAISKDTGVNAQIIYTIVEGNEQGKFDLHPITGVISVVQQIDYEQTKWYLLTVLATDQGLPPLSSQTTVNITVLDSNDNAPVFSQTAFSAQVPEDVQVGEIILKLEAADRDSGANARVGYSLESGDSLHQFSLDLNTGELSVAKTLDRESIAEYSLTIQASDFGSPQLSSSVFISVSVLDVNDNPPTLTQDNYTFFVQEDKMPGWAVGQMIVSDVDTFPNGAPFSFSILSGNADLAFRVVSDGTLYTAARLSTRVRSVYYLQVRVGDSGFPPLHTDSWITVKVIEESQFAPTVLPLEVFIIAYQERWPGGEIGHLIASDQDPYDTLVFALEASPAGQGQFSVEPRRGVLTAGPMVDAGRYRLNISVSDGKFTTHTTVTVHVLPLWEDMLQHSVSIRLRSMTAHHFVLRQWKSLVQLLESALLRQVSLTSLQAVPHGDLDILLTITGGVELAVLSEALQSAGLSGANWSCDCHNGALCRQKVQIQRDLVFTVATDHVSFVCPGHSHQLYCACNLGYGGEYCEEILPGGECGCPPPQGCVPQAGAPGGYICVPPSCPPSHSCPPATTASIHWEEIVAVIVAFLIVSCLVAVFILYRRCHRISPGNRVDKSELNHVIKRTSKLSNLQVTQPSRPTSYTCSSNNEVFSAVALNNAERGTAEADNVPPDYRRNLMSPHHKINNDLKQTADIPLHQVIPAEDDTRTIGGFHWDCTEWLQNGDVHTTILGDSSSYHSNDSCLTGDPARELATLDTKLNSQEDQVIPYGFPSSLDVCS